MSEFIGTLGGRPVVVDPRVTQPIEFWPTCVSCGQPYPAVDQAPGSEQCYDCRHDEMIEPPEGAR